MTLAVERDVKTPTLTFTTAPATTQEKKRATEPLGNDWILRRQERECYKTLLANLIQQTTPHQEVSHNFRKPLEVGLKLAIKLRHLETGDTLSLQYQWLVGRTIICKFIPKVYQGGADRAPIPADDIT